MREQSRIGYWLLWGGLVLLGLSFGACFGLPGIGIPWQMILAITTLSGMILAVIGALMVFFARR